MDLRAVKAARRTELSTCAFAAARNGRGLLHDAEVLARSGSTARAYSVAALAVEECGKAACLAALALLPRALRAQAPVGRLLEWHQLKLVGGLVIATEAEVASQLATARQAVDSASLLLGPETQARIANPSAEAIELTRALCSVLESRPDRTSRATRFPTKPARTIAAQGKTARTYR